jgi:hypothetical protein
MSPNIPFFLYTGQHVDILHQPLWWSQETAFLAFLPITPNFAGVPFEEFDTAELRSGPTGYFMQGDALLKWKQTESLLQALIQSFANTYEIPEIRTWKLFSRMLPNEAYQHRRLFQFMLKYTKGWLSLYMAIIAYVMAVAQEIDKDDPGDDMRPTWFLKMDQYDQILLSGLRSYTAYTYAVERVGIFLKIVEPAIHQVSIDLLIKYCIPVWYRWGPEEISIAKRDRSVDRLAPPPDQLQRATQFLTKDPSPQPKNPDRPWVAFFEKRQNDLQFLTRSETPRNRQSRLDRERNPPTVKTKVYVWSRGGDGKFERQIVFQRENSDTLSRYREYQKVYNSFWNEWDCCYTFRDPTATEMEEADWLDSDEDDLDLPEAPYETIPSQTTSGTPSSNPPPPTLPAAPIVCMPAHSASDPPPTTPPTLPTAEPVTRWVPHCRAPDRAHTYDVQTYPAAEILHHFFGFVLPIPVPKKHPRPATLSEKDFRLFAAIVNEDGLDEGFRDSTIMQYCHEFVKGLERNGTPPNELFDLAIGNSKSIGGVGRVRFLRKRGTNLISLVLPEPNVPWDLTVTNAIDALFLCRLEVSMTDLELCHFLLQRGVQFRTLLPISSRDARPSPIPPKILPLRGAGYVFTATDYDAYVQERAALLRSARLRRAALMSGGIVWRLVVSEVSFSEALQGPTIATTTHGCGLFVPGSKSDCSFCDDTLSESEGEAICGRVYCYTGMKVSLFGHTWYLFIVGRGQQREERSWWPTDRQWKAFVAHTRWGGQQEKFFRQREKALEAGDAKPLNASQWRKLLRSAQTARIARSNMEAMANKFLEPFFT